jgi:hypothetical protein
MFWFFHFLLVLEFESELMCFFSAQFIVETSRIFNVCSKCFPSGCLPFTKIVQVVCTLQKYLMSSNLSKTILAQIYVRPTMETLVWGCLQFAKIFQDVCPLQIYLRSSYISLRLSSICKNISGCLPFTDIFEVVFPLQKYLRSSVMHTSCTSESSKY